MLISTLQYTKILNYKKILSEIASEREMPEFAKYIEEYDPFKVPEPEAEIDPVYTELTGQKVYKMEIPVTKVEDVTEKIVADANAYLDGQKKSADAETVKTLNAGFTAYKITKMPEATCDGCQ